MQREEEGIMKKIARNIALWSMEGVEDGNLVVVEHGIELLLEKFTRVVIVMIVGMLTGYGV